MTDDKKLETVAVSHPLRGTEFRFSASLIPAASDGDRGALGRLYGEAALALKGGYPLPPELAAFVGDRLLALARQVGSAAPLVPAQIQHAMIGSLPRGGAARAVYPAFKRDVREYYSYRRRLGYSSVECLAQTVEAFKTVKPDLTEIAVKRLIAPSQTRRAPPKRRS